MQILCTIKMPAIRENFPALMQAVADCARSQEISSEKLYGIELATEEALVNIFNYAYQGSHGEVEIVCMRDDKKNFVMDIIDSGAPFDLLSVKDPDVSTGIAERPVGGLGIYFIKKFTDDVCYRREAGKNILRLTVLAGDKLVPR
jgi:serine/threonine-protein kinase RsbW